MTIPMPFPVTHSAVYWPHSSRREAVLPVDPVTGDVTVLLRAWSAGDRAAEERLFEIVLPDLHRLAHYFLRRESPDHSLQATALLNEAYLRLVNARERDWEHRKHFFAIAARVMRRLLIDHARGRFQGKKVPLDGMADLLRGREAHLEQAILIDSLLDELEEQHPDWCPIVEMRFFLGLSEEETAEALGVPRRTAQRRYSEARRWLYERMEARPCLAKPNTTNS